MKCAEPWVLAVRKDTEGRVGKSVECRRSLSWGYQKVQKLQLETGLRESHLQRSLLQDVEWENHARSLGRHEGEAEVGLRQTREVAG